MIDENFFCGRDECSGILVPIGRDEKGRIYSCNICHIGTQFECPTCKNPRTIFNKKGVCWLCSKKELLKFEKGILEKLKEWSKNKGWIN